MREHKNISGWSRSIDSEIFPRGSLFRESPREKPFLHPALHADPTQARWLFAPKFNGHWIRGNGREVLQRLAGEWRRCNLETIIPIVSILESIASRALSSSMMTVQAHQLYVSTFALTRVQYIRQYIRTAPSLRRRRGIVVRENAGGYWHNSVLSAACNEGRDLSTIYPQPLSSPFETRGARKQSRHACGALRKRPGRASR